MVTRARFEDLTETTGIPISREGAIMMFTRYEAARKLAAGRRVLELGCGAGQGFGLIASAARSVIGGDFSMPLLRTGQRHYRGRFPLVRLSGDRLPFATAAFDLVLFFEASYYVPDMSASFAEIARVVAPGGGVLFVNANPERPDFIRSPHSVRYHSADEFRTALSAVGFTVTVAGAFPVEESHGGSLARIKTGVLSVARRVLEALGVIPRTLRGRARLKRLIYGKLLEVPPELKAGFAPTAPLTPLGPGAIAGFKVIYVTATRAEQPPR